MIVGRLIGWLLLFAGLAILCRDFLGWYELGAYASVSLGRLWSDLHATSLEALLARVPDWLLNTLSGTLALPAAGTLAVIAVLILWLCRRRAGRRRR